MSPSTKEGEQHAITPDRILRGIRNSLRMEVQIKEDALISAQQQIRFIRQQVSSKMSDRVLGNYQFSRVN